MVLGRSPVKLLSGTEQMESGLGNQTERAHLNLGNHRRRTEGGAYLDSGMPKEGTCDR